MRIWGTTLRRILIAISASVALIAFCVYWVAPVATSFWTAHRVPIGARQVPVDLSDLSISQSAGKNLSYFGYAFEIPWTDIDETKTKLYPNKVVIKFHSGLVLTATALPPDEYIKGFASGFKISPQNLQSAFGTEATRSDYAFLKNLYELSPKTLHYWAIDPSIHYREGMLLTIKSISLSSGADSGIFKIHNQTYEGFQQGDPSVRPVGIEAELFSSDGKIEFMLTQKNYNNPMGVSQAEVNRIIQSLHKVALPRAHL